MLEEVWRTPRKERKSAAGRKPWDAVVMFKVIVLGALYNLSDEALEHEIGDRLTFMEFVGLGLQDRTPDATTVWLYRDRLARAGLVEALFGKFDAFLRARGYEAMGGQIVDASIVAVPKQRNSGKENEEIKSGEIPEEWAGLPNKLAQKDLDARWTKKHGKSFYGYKNHISADRRHKLVRRYAVTDAAVHDSQVIGSVLDEDNTAGGVWRTRPTGPRRSRGTGGRGTEEQDPAKGAPGQEADQAGAAGQPDEVEGAGARGARLRGAGERHGRHVGAQHRTHAGTGAYRNEESGVQHAQACAPGKRGVGPGIGRPVPGRAEKTTPAARVAQLALNLGAQPHPQVGCRSNPVLLAITQERKRRPRSPFCSRSPISVGPGQ